MRLTQIVTLFVLGLVVLSSMIEAQQQLQKKTPLTLKEVMDLCIIVVRQETDSQVGFKMSQFDAYLKSNGIIAFFGSPKERFSFEKCMTEKGYPSNK